jgi:hypothetical protein
LVHLKPKRLRFLQEHSGEVFVKFLESISCQFLPDGLVLAPGEDTGVKVKPSATGRAPSHALEDGLPPMQPSMPVPLTTNVSPTPQDADVREGTIVTPYPDGNHATAHEPPMHSTHLVALGLAFARLYIEVQLHKHAATCAKNGRRGDDCDCRMALPQPCVAVTTFTATGHIRLRRAHRFVVACAPAVTLGLACNTAFYIFASSNRHERDVELWQRAVAESSEEVVGPRPQLQAVEDAAAEGSEYSFKYLSKIDGVGAAAPALRLACFMPVAAASSTQTQATPLQGAQLLMLLPCIFYVAIFVSKSA